MKPSKDTWRVRLKRAAGDMEPTRRRTAGRRIEAHLARLIDGIRPRRIFAFWPMSTEPDIRSFLCRMQKSGIPVLLPKVCEDRIFFHPFRATRNLAPGAFGILEPRSSGRPVRPLVKDLILVPCVGLDARTGRRLGHGHGYYDRWLSSNPKTVRVAVVFRAQIKEGIPHTRNDARIGAAVSEAGIHAFIV